MIKQIALINHDAGLTLQYEDQQNNNTLLITYGKINGKYALTNVAGPWSGVDRNGSDDPKDWRAIVLGGWDEQKRYMNDQAILFLTILNATFGGGVQVAATMWSGAKYGL